MAGMKPHHGATLALVVWYLMTPPLPHLKPPAAHKDTDPPLREWKMVKSFPSQRECEAHLKRWELCIASDDPRLEEK
jgi:hypothetical protein